MRYRLLILSTAVLLLSNILLARNFHNWQVSETKINSFISGIDQNQKDKSVSSSLAVVGFNYDENLLFKSSDQGKTWLNIYKTMINTKIPKTSNLWYGISYPSENLYFISGDTVKKIYINGHYLDISKGFLTIYNSIDDSARTISFDTNTRVADIKMLNSDYGGLLLATIDNEINPEVINDSLLITTDRWKSWKSYPLPTECYAERKLFCFSEDKFLIFAADGFLQKRNIFLTNDGGISWNKREGTPDRVDKIYFLNDTIGWAVGQQVLSAPPFKSCIYKTTDGGKSWVKEVDSCLSTAIGINNISFVDSKSGVAVGDSGLILVTNDGGESWASEKINDNEWDSEDLYFISYQSADSPVIMSHENIFRSIDNFTLPAPFIINPPITAFEQYIDLFLKWTRVEDADHYQIQIVKGEESLFFGEDYEKNLWFDSTLIDTTYHASNFEWNSTFTFRVRAIKDSRPGCWSYLRTFSTLENENQLPSPMPMMPAVGSHPDAKNIKFFWNKVNKADNYEIQVARNKLFSSSYIVKFVSGITDTSCLIKGLDKSSEYYWRVRANNSFSTSNWSSVNRGDWYFITNDTTGIDENMQPGTANYHIYPHPVDNTMTFNYQVDKYSYSTLLIYNSVGVETGSYINEWQQSGEYKLTVDLTNQPEGIYFYKFVSGKIISCGKFIILRNQQTSKE